MKIASLECDPVGKAIYRLNLVVVGFSTHIQIYNFIVNFIQLKEINPMTIVKFDDTILKHYSNCVFQKKPSFLSHVVV